VVGARVAVPVEDWGVCADCVVVELPVEEERVMVERVKAREGAARVEE
jgi:hypothetical protein